MGEGQMHKFKCKENILFLMKIILVVSENRIGSSNITYSGNSPLHSVVKILVLTLRYYFKEESLFSVTVSLLI